MKDRIKHLMESQHMTQQTFAEFLGISSAALSSMFNGRTNPTLNTVDAIRRKFSKINLEWLLYGSGPMFLDEQPADPSASSPVASPTEEPLLDFGAPSSAQQSAMGTPHPALAGHRPASGSQPLGSNGMRPGSNGMRSGTNGQPATSYSAAGTRPSAYLSPQDAQLAMKLLDKPQRKITEIRIFFDDQTWETFVPKTSK